MEPVDRLAYSSFSRRKFLAGTALGLPAALLLAACGGAATPASSTASTASSNAGGASAGAAAPSGATATSASAKAGAAAGAAGAQLVMAVPLVQGNTDPHQYDTTPHGEYSPAFIGRLLRYKATAASSKTLPGPADLEGDLAQTYSIDATGVKMTLRDARSPYGNTLSADDVKWSLERMLALKNSTAAFLATLAGLNKDNPVTVVDSKTVHLNLTPAPLTPAVLADYILGVLDSVEAKKHATSGDPWAKTWLATHSASYGPYTVDSITPKQELRLSANKNYWGGVPHFTQAIIRAVPESSSRLQLLESKEVNWARYLSLSDFASLKGKPGVDGVGLPSLSQDYLFLTETIKPFQDARVRQAMSLAINREALLKGPYFGIGQIASSSITSAIPQGNSSRSPFPYDVAKAKSLLSDAGFSSGFDFAMAINTGASNAADAQSVAVLLQSQLSQVGIKATINNVAANSEFFASAYGSHPSKYQSWFATARPIVADGAYLYNLLFISKALSNGTNFNDPKVDSLVAEAMKTPAGPAREQLMAQASDEFQQQLPALPLIELKQNEAFAAGITGLQPSPFGYVNIQDLKQG